MSEEWKDDDIIYRQVHPNHWDGKDPFAVAFLPSLQHEYQLSVDDGRITDPKACWNHYTDNLKMSSVGTWALSVLEIRDAADLNLFRDPVSCPDEPHKDNPAHCLIDFNLLETKGQRKNRAQKLAIKASERGCRYLASS